ncbi:hypothetical protein [Dyadobacter sp. NIV53]|uniref:hypothetical protein n=1 Tax=Dyadobacter sp. NIV53 TaxID=2861765 RepID=UPI001C87BF38|nr:hypothetical protein [Dyadobacter sp. NIV53]
MNKEEKIQLIEDYLDEKLNPEQHLLFQQQMENDAALLQDVKMHQLLMKGIVLEKSLAATKTICMNYAKTLPFLPLILIPKKRRKYCRYGDGVARLLL